MFLLPEMNVIFPFAKKIYSGLFFTKIDKVKKGLTFFWENGSKTKTKKMALNKRTCYLTSLKQRTV